MGTDASDLAFRFTGRRQLPLRVVSATRSFVLLASLGSELTPIRADFDSCEMLDTRARTPCKLTTLHFASVGSVTNREATTDTVRWPFSAVVPSAMSSSLMPDTVTVCTLSTGSCLRLRVMNFPPVPVEMTLSRSCSTFSLYVGFLQSFFLVPHRASPL